MLNREAFKEEEGAFRDHFTTRSSYVAADVRNNFVLLVMRAYHVLLCLRILMVIFCLWVLICGAVMASHYAYTSRDMLIIAVVLDALLMVFGIFLIVDVLKRYYLQFPARVALKVMRKTRMTKLFRKMHKSDPRVHVATKLVESPTLDWANALHDFVLSFHLKYITLVAVVIAGIVAWMITTSATTGTMATLTVGFAWHTVTCMMMDSVTQLYASGPGQVIFSQTTPSSTHTGSALA